MENAWHSPMSAIRLSPMWILSIWTVSMRQIRRQFYSERLYHHPARRQRLRNKCQKPFRHARRWTAWHFSFIGTITKEKICRMSSVAPTSIRQTWNTLTGRPSATTQKASSRMWSTKRKNDWPNEKFGGAFLPWLLCVDRNEIARGALWKYCEDCVNLSMVRFRL